jgi:oligoribonuclease (3'-5' exoribonuclease)
MKKHHKSNFEDATKLKKMLDGKESNLKFNSIHKIENILPKYNKNFEELPSRNTIETSSINRFVSMDNPSILETTAKKSRINKISIMGKLERTIKKIQIKNLKKPRGGMYFQDEKLK